MKLATGVRDFARAAGLIAPLIDGNAKSEVLRAMYLTAGDGRVTLSINTLDHYAEVTFAAKVEREGDCASPGARISALLAALPDSAAIQIEANANGVTFTSGRSRYRLPAWPIGDLPAPLVLGEPIGEVELEHANAVRVFTEPLFAAAIEKVRFNLNGVLLQTSEESLFAVTTDGSRLCRVMLPVKANLSSDRKLIVPLPAVRHIIKLLKIAWSERVTLRRSRTLLEIEDERIRFVTKLVDGEFPPYDRIIPTPAGNSVICGNAELSLALRRLAAIGNGALSGVPVCGLEWHAGENCLRLSLPRQGDSAADAVGADVIGECRLAVGLNYFAELVEQAPGTRLHLNATSSSNVAIIATDPDNNSWLSLLMPMHWPQSRAEAA